MKKLDFDRTVTTRAFNSNAYREGAIRLVTHDSSEYMNLIVQSDDTLHPDDARALRDALIEAYPLRGHKAPHASQEYRGNGEHTFEPVTKGVERLRVPGGWLYRDHDSMEAVFVPMPAVVKHKV